MASESPRPLTRMEKLDTLVIGAGIVGLAVARALALAGHEVMVLEAESAIGTGISARNSEVIHAGIYYPAGSLKARLCVAGARQLYAYCGERGIAHQRCGKLIVATDAAQLDALTRTEAHARRNGVTDLRRLDAASACAMEPALSCVGALLSPSTGIVDSHAVMQSLHGDIEQAGGMVVLRTPVCGGRVTPQGIELSLGGSDPATVLARRVVNCAGLGAPAIARQIIGLPAESVPPLHYAKGNYFSLSGRSPFSHLIYPVPEAHGLGVHLTLDLGGQARFGPDVEWIDEPDYQVDPARAAGFYGAIRRYWPGLPDDALQAAYAGIRPKPHGPGEASRDFLILGPREHGVGGLVNLFGIESPGLTSSLAIGDAVTMLMADQG